MMVKIFATFSTIIVLVLATFSMRQAEATTLGARAGFTKVLDESELRPRGSRVLQYD
jgi:hypothetical protein